MPPLFGRLQSSLPDSSGFEITIESLSPDDDLAVEVAAVAVTVRLFPFRIGRVSQQGSGHRVTARALMLDDPRPHNVSREHCVFELRDGQIWLRDCESTLGTVLNGEHLGTRHGQVDQIVPPGESELLLGGHHSPHRFRLCLSRQPG
ncbi:MAG: FHA domain-containing protein [Verrucomicrobiales bacterium]|nr:FHA domain-containing protein [Verrucomicrobiales bacterium]